MTNLVLPLDIEPGVNLLDRIRTMTDDEFYFFCRANEDLNFERNSPGDILVTGPTDGNTGERNSELTANLAMWNRQRKLGFVYASSTAFRLPNGAVRSPDAAWVSADRRNALTPEQRKKFPPLCPDFVVELMSESDSVKDALTKMKKLIILTGCCLIWVKGVAQPRIECSFKPSFDAPATIELHSKDSASLQLIFKQTGKKRPTSYFTWGDDSTKLVEVRKMGRYFQQFAFSDTIVITQQEAPILFESFRQVYSQANRLAKSKDERLKVDGLSCHILVVSAGQAQYEWKYGPPLYENNKATHQLVQATLMALKMKSKNPATVNYCMIADGYIY